MHIKGEVFISVRRTLSVVLTVTVVLLCLRVGNCAATEMGLPNFHFKQETIKEVQILNYYYFYHH